MSFSILFALLLLSSVEIGARLILSYSPLFRRVSRRSDSAWRLEWARRHHTPSAAARYSFDIYHPTRGWALKPDLNHFSMARGKQLTTNSRGLRSQVEYSYDAPQHGDRILVLGDSFTFGEDVSDWETYSHVLGELLPEDQVLNFGVHGYGLDQMLLYLREEGVKYHPDWVILGYVDEDIYRGILTFRDYAKPRFQLAERNSLILENVPVPPPEHFLKWEVYYPRTLDLVQVLHEARRWNNGANRRDSEAIARAIVLEMVRTIREMGAVPAIFYLPVENELADRGSEPTRGEAYLQSVCREAGVSFHSLRGGLAAEVEPGEREAIVGHWPARIHARAAALIRNSLAAESPSKEAR
ncbi:MAG: SGNH/GDSL hydrolase family protein [Acidobacteria bacterium]|nr:SGNH/GDSL hydrolase family protein [Acidobacteriota bacterium]